MSSKSPTCALILDVDDTILKEVSIVEFEGNASTQTITYVPSSYVVKKYRRRLNHCETKNPTKVIHYRFVDGSSTDRIESTVVVRPGMSELIRDFLERNRGGSYSLLLASANDDARTEAVCEQVQIGGETLSKLGFSWIPRDIFLRKETCEGKSRLLKDVSAIRKYAGLDDLCLCIFVDDKDEDIVGRSRGDHVVRNVPPFDNTMAEKYLRVVRPSKWKTSDKWTKVRRSVLSAAYRRPKLGVSLAFLRAFSKSLRKEGATTAEVCLSRVKLLCKSNPSLSFADLINRGIAGSNFTKEMVGRATHFVSHAWRYKFVDNMVNALERTYPKNEDSNGNVRYFWIDIFVVPQCEIVMPPQAWWATAFFHAVASVPFFVIIWTTWDDPICCRRAWCLWEIYAALFAGRSVEDSTLIVAMPESESRMWQRAILADVHKVAKTILSIDGSKAEATDTNDLPMIIYAIKSHTFSHGLVGFKGLNAAIKKLLRRWIERSGNELCDELQSSQIAGKSKQEYIIRCSSLLHKVAMISHQNGNNALAEKRFRSALSMRQTFVDKKNSEISRTTGVSANEIRYQLGRTLLKSVSKMEDATNLFCSVYEDANAPMMIRLRAHKMMARSLMARNKISTALSSLRECRQQLSNCDVRDEKDEKGRLRQCYHVERLMGECCRRLGRLEEARDILESVQSQWGSLDGKYHENCLDTTIELAATLSRLGSDMAARDAIVPVLECRVSNLGATHLKTREAREEMNRLNKRLALREQRQRRRNLALLTCFLGVTAGLIGNAVIWST